MISWTSVKLKSECNPSITLYVSDILPFSFDLSGTDSALYPYDPEQGYFRNFWFPTTNMYPYFLFPPTSRPHRLPAPHGTAHTAHTVVTYRTHETGTAIDHDNRVIGKGFNSSYKQLYPGFPSLTGLTEHGEPNSPFSFVRIVSSEWSVIRELRPIALRESEFAKWPISIGRLSLLHWDHSSRMRFWSNLVQTCLLPLAVFILLIYFKFIKFYKDTINK